VLGYGFHRPVEIASRGLHRAVQFHEGNCPAAVCSASGIRRGIQRTMHCLATLDVKLRFMFLTSRFLNRISAMMLNILLLLQGFDEDLLAMLRQQYPGADIFVEQHRM
jgi:hypothetical protein